MKPDSDTGTELNKLKTSDFDKWFSAFMSIEMIIIISRFVGYIGVSISSLIFPILVYTITKSITLVGVVMLFEGLPKLFIYLFGGNIIHKLSTELSYKLIDLLRAFTFILFGLAVYFDNYYFLMVAAPIAQGSNAISNILFESLVSHWWEESKKTNGQSTLMQFDIFSGIIIVPVIAYASMNYIIVAGFCVFIISFLMGRKVKYRHVAPLNIKAGKPNFIENFKFIVSNKKLLTISLFGLISGVPIVLILSQLPIFIQMFNAELAKSTSFIANFKAVMSVASISFLFAIKYIKNLQRVFFASFALFAISIVGILVAKTVYVFLTAFLFSLVAFYGIAVYSRSYRQSQLPADKRLELTAILISIEACSYVLASLLLIVFNNQFLTTIKYVFVLIIIIFIAHVRSTRVPTKETAELALAAIETKEEIEKELV